MISLNQRIRRKHLKRFYRHQLETIQNYNRQTKYELVYIPKNKYHADYLMIQEKYAGLTMTVFNMDFNNEIIDYQFPNEAALNQFQILTAMEIVDYFTNGDEDSWQIGKSLTIKPKPFIVKSLNSITEFTN